MSRDRAPERPGAERKGFSLLEILIAMVVFTIGIIAVMYLFPFGVQDISRAKELTAATCLAQAKLEEALLLPYDPVELPDTVDSDFGSDYPGMTYRMECRKFQNSLSMVHISIEVFKILKSGQRKTLIHLDTIKSTGGSLETN